MPDQQIESVLAEARQAFVVDSRRGGENANNTREGSRA
jgi:hypothetical protein